MMDLRNGVYAPERTDFPVTMEIITDANLPDRPTVAEVARWLRRSKHWVYIYARKGRIPHKRVGGAYIFNKSVLIEWARREEAA